MIDISINYSHRGWCYEIRVGTLKFNHNGWFNTFHGCTMDIKRTFYKNKLDMKRLQKKFK